MQVEVKDTVVGKVLKVMVRWLCLSHCFFKVWQDVAY